MLKCVVLWQPQEFSTKKTFYVAYFKTVLTVYEWKGEGEGVGGGACNNNGRKRKMRILPPPHPSKDIKCSKALYIILRFHRKEFQ